MIKPRAKRMVLLPEGDEVTRRGLWPPGARMGGTIAASLKTCSSWVNDIKALCTSRRDHSRCRIRRLLGCLFGGRRLICLICGGCLDP